MVNGIARGMTLSKATGGSLRELDAAIQRLKQDPQPFEVVLDDRLSSRSGDRWIERSHLR